MNPGRIIVFLICVAFIVLGVSKLAAGDNTWGVIFTFIGLMNLIRWWKNRKSQ
ncbi:MAG: hypothetical protein J6M22_00530 [Firmicutes bacterium]|nr:hypothetical protein [Bacillota bacterium]